MALMSPDVVAAALERLSPHIRETPLLESDRLNALLDTRIVFKVEPMQRIGAFKIRGALNALLAAKERGKLPEWVVAHSSGNHSQAVACAAKMLGIRATICLPSVTSPIKIQATKGYGAEVVILPNRKEAEAAVQDYVKQGAFFLPPYDNDDVIAGQGTACLESLKAGLTPDAIFAPCGGGGLLSGTYLAAQLMHPSAHIYGAEPKRANDAAQSIAKGSIVSLPDSPDTIADGVTTLSVAPRTFEYLQKINGMMEIEEETIIYWTQWLMHLLKVSVEPTSALAMAACAQWIEKEGQGKTALVILSGGNIAPATYRKVWEKDMLEKIPAV